MSACARCCQCVRLAPSVAVFDASEFGVNGMRVNDVGSGLDCGQVLGFGGVVWGLVENRKALQTQVAIEFYRRYAEIAAQMPNDPAIGGSG